MTAHQRLAIIVAAMAHVGLAIAQNARRRCFGAANATGQD
jgi:hypothetical protein